MDFELKIEFDSFEGTVGDQGTSMKMKNNVSPNS